MYNYYQPHQSLTYLKGRPVTSIDEVKATTIDFDGSIFYFPDLANNRIYTKQINLNGTVSINVYELKPISPELTTDYITREEFDKLAEKINSLIPKEQQEFNFK